MTNWKELTENISNKESLKKFVEDLLLDFRNKPQGWKNATLDTFLEAIATCIDDIEGLYANMNKMFPEQPTWKLFAEILISAKYYE